MSNADNMRGEVLAATPDSVTHTNSVTCRMQSMFGGTALDEALSHRKRGIVELLRSRGGLKRSQLHA